MSSEYMIFSGDAEASGPLPPFFSMLSIGFVKGRGKRKCRFYRELKPLHGCYDAESMKYTKFSPEVTRRAEELGGGPESVLQALQELGTEPSLAMRECALWIRRHARGKKPLFVGSAAPWDWQYIQYYFHRFLGFNPFGFTALDIKAYYMGMTGCAWEETAKKSLPDAFRPRVPHSHKSDEDAEEQHGMFAACEKFNARRFSAAIRVVEAFDRVNTNGAIRGLGKNGLSLKRAVSRFRKMLNADRKRVAS